MPFGQLGQEASAPLTGIGSVAEAGVTSIAIAAIVAANHFT